MLRAQDPAPLAMAQQDPFQRLLGAPDADGQSLFDACLLQGEDGAPIGLESLLASDMLNAPWMPQPPAPLLQHQQLNDALRVDEFFAPAAPAAVDALKRRQEAASNAPPARYNAPPTANTAGAESLLALPGMARAKACSLPLTHSLGACRESNSQCAPSSASQRDRLAVQGGGGKGSVKPESSLEGSDGCSTKGGEGVPDLKKAPANSHEEDEWMPRIARKRLREDDGEDSSGPSQGRTGRITAKSMTERQRRNRISDALKRLRDTLHGHGDMATMLNEAVEHIQGQQKKIDELEMQLLQVRLMQQIPAHGHLMF